MINPLSIALVRQRYAADGGAERFVARAIEALQGESLAITLISRQWADSAAISVQVCDPFHIGRWWRDRSFARCVCDHLQHQQYDLVQSHERIACCDLYRAGDGVHREWLRQLARVRGPLGRLGLRLNPYHAYVKRAERRLFENPRLRAVVCNSNMVRDEILSDYSISPEKLHVIYSGVDLETYHPRLFQHRQEVRERYAIPPDTPLFLFVGSGFERKGVAVLLKALAILPGDAHVLIVGRDKHVSRYLALARHLGVSDRSHFIGPQPDVRQYYGAADVLVLPTLYDPFPNVALEAMASGLPVITSTKCGAAELIREGENGFVRDALDVDGFAEAMQAAVMPDKYITMREKARSTVSDFSLDRWRNTMLSLYRQLLNRQSSQ